MKNKLKILTPLIMAIIIFAPLNSQAFSTGYNVIVRQSPDTGNVRVGDSVRIYAILKLLEPDDTIFDIVNNAILSWWKNGDFQAQISCNQVLPGIHKTITFTLGPFLIDNRIEYEVFLDLKNSWNYRSSMVSFIVYHPDVLTTTESEIPTDEEGFWTEQYQNITRGVGVAIALFVVVGWVFKRRGGSGE